MEGVPYRFGVGQRCGTDTATTKDGCERATKMYISSPSYKKLTQWAPANSRLINSSAPIYFNQHLFCICSRYSLLSRYNNDDDELLRWPTASITNMH
jgi:hypothetical protein